MSKIDIISGFLGAGKTTLIKKLIAEAYQNEKIVLIENEFGEIGIDGTFLKDSGVTINEMNSGCICCSLVGDFETSLKEVLDTYHPDRVIIEPSGVGKLSDVIKAVSTINSDEMELDNFITVVDAKKCRMYTKNFGEFYNNQVEHASLIVLSRSQDLTEFQLKECLDILKGLNDHSPIITTAWDTFKKNYYMNMNIITIMITNVNADMTIIMNTIMTMNVVDMIITNMIMNMDVADMTIMNTITTMNVVDMTIMNTITNMNVVDIIITMTMIMNVVVDIITIMLMKYLIVSDLILLKNIMKLN